MYLLRPYLVTTETLVDRRSRSAPLGMVYATLENAPDQWKMAANWRRCAALLQFWWTETDTSIQFAWITCISIKSLSYRFSRHPTASALLQITNHLLFQVSTRSFLCSFKHWTNSHRNAFYKSVSSVKPYSIFFRKTALMSHSREIQKMLFFPLCGCYCCLAF